MFGPQSLSRATIALRIFIRVGKISKTIAAYCIHIEKPRIRVKAGRDPVCTTTSGDIKQSSICLRLFFRIGNWLALWIHADGPICADKRCRYQVLAVGSVENKKISIASCLREQLSLLPMNFRIEQNWRFDVIPIMRVMR